MVSPSDLINSLIARVTSLFGLSRFNNLMDTLLSENYNDGLERGEKELDMNFVPNENSKNNLRLLGRENLKNFEEEMTNKLKGVLMRAITNGEDRASIKKKLTGFFANKPNETKFSWSDRLDTILRTELNRANNVGTFDAAQESDIPGLRKWLLVTMDNRTSCVCKEEHKKYGSPAQSIPINEEFKVRCKNKVFISMHPPFLPNCRTLLQIDTSEVKR